MLKIGVLGMSRGVIIESVDGQSGFTLPGLTLFDMRGHDGEMSQGFESYKHLKFRPTHHLKTGYDVIMTL